MDNEIEISKEITREMDWERTMGIPIVFNFKPGKRGEKKHLR
jgi:hypothetical protein